jgi:hypothetical protein
VGARPDLDLSVLLEGFNRTWLFPDQEGIDDAPETNGIKFPEPVRLGWGPDQWSASTELAVPIVFIWDVNGYYASLGVGHQATRKELRQAYQALDGQESAYLTYVFKQLLDPEVRAEYDRSPLGAPFLDDYQGDDLKRRAAKEAGLRSEKGKPTSPKDVLYEWGYTSGDQPEGVDSVSSDLEDHSSKAEPLRYSYYGWKTSTFLPDTEQLQEWQRLLTAAAAKLRVAPKISFGVTGSSDRPYILHTVHGQTVIFFPEGEEPTEEVAFEAIDQLCKSL